MNDVIKSGNIIKKIRDGKQLEEIALFARNCIFRDGPKDTLILEILSYLKLFQPTFFEKFEDELIETMGLFFKNPSPDTLQGVVFDMYRQHIKEKYGEDYTPMQASILEQIEDKHHFSFSAPTSTGKSFVFRNLIRSASNDVVVIVPSRALINEYYDRIREIVNVKEVNVLTFVDRIPLAELHPFKGHPFKVQNNEEMQRMIESIRKVGAITPALARPLPDGGYELISGHRRLAACQVLGVETMPVIVRELSDDEAVIAMVDANLQREIILPSEKAFAYKMKLDAIKHQGVTSAQVGQKLLSVEKVADDAGESRNQIKRYIRLTYLIPELLSMVDDGKIAFNPAVELSYLDSYQQRAVLDAMELNDCTPSHAQSIRLKKLAQEGLLDDQTIYAVLAETKPNQQEQLKFKREELRKYFPSGYTEEQMRRDIIKGLELLKRQRERNRDAR